jgi:hypothetical protein
VHAPILIGIIDVTAIPGLTLFFGSRLLFFSACAAAQADDEESSRDDVFQAGAYLFHIFLVLDLLTYLATLPHDALQRVIAPVPMDRQ